MLNGQYDFGSYEKAVERLLNDGTIYSTYDPDVFSLDGWAYVKFDK